jgi:poly(A) polymerase
VRQHMRPHFMAKESGQISRRAIYRFFQATGQAGVDICLLSLADRLATSGPGLSQDVWTRQLDVVRALLEAYWEQPEQSVSPPPLISGHDLINLFDLVPGVQIGNLLQHVREAQATGEIQDRQQALDFIRRTLDITPDADQ